MKKALVALALLLALPAAAQSPVVTVKESPRWGSFQVSLSPFSPNIDSEFTNALYPPYATIFGTGRPLMVQAQFNKSVWITEFGTLDVGVGAGFWEAWGQGWYQGRRRHVAPRREHEPHDHPAPGPGRLPVGVVLRAVQRPARALRALRHRGLHLEHQRPERGLLLDLAGRRCLPRLGRHLRLGGHARDRASCSTPSTPACRARWTTTWASTGPCSSSTSPGRASTTSGRRRAGSSGPATGPGAPAPVRLLAGPLTPG